MSIDYQLTSIFDERSLVDGEDSDHDEPTVQNLDTLHD